MWSPTTCHYFLTLPSWFNFLKLKFPFLYREFIRALIGFGVQKNWVVGVKPAELELCSQMVFNARMVERLYGIEHGISLTVEGIPIPGTETPIAPSRELIQDLLQLPKGSSVGIEFASQFQAPFDVDGVEINAGYESNFYWRRIKRVTDMAKLNLIYLEDFDTYKKYVRKLMEAKAFEQQASELYLENADFFETNGAKQLAAKHYMADVEAQYIFVVEREVKIADKIRDTNPTVVILGKGHTDYLTQNQSDANPIQGAKYTREIVFHRPWHWSEESQLPFERARVDYSGEVDRGILLDRELLERKYRALMQKRITQGEEPDFMGTWDVDCQPRGLFEIFVEGARFGGRIEDTLGTALFEGTITDSEISFVKAYVREKSSHETAKDPIHYTGSLTNGQYEGHYEVVNTHISGRFTLQKL